MTSRNHHTTVGLQVGRSVQRLESHDKVTGRAEYTHLLRLTGMLHAKLVVTVPWKSDGLQSFRVSIEARSKTGSGQVLISAINATRIWPVVAGSPRYYEPSSAGQ